LSDAGVFREAPRDRTKHYSGASFGTSDKEREIGIVTVGLRGIVDAYA